MGYYSATLNLVASHAVDRPLVRLGCTGCPNIKGGKTTRTVDGMEMTEALAREHGDSLDRETID